MKILLPIKKETIPVIINQTAKFATNYGGKMYKSTFHMKEDSALLATLQL